MQRSTATDRSASKVPVSTKRLATLRLPFPVSINEMYVASRNSSGRDRWPSPALKAWKAEAGLLLNTQRPPKIIERVEIHIDLDDRRQGDCDNRVKCVIDLLVEQGIIKGDRKKYVKRISSGWEQTDSCIVRIDRAPDEAGTFQFGETHDSETDSIRRGVPGNRRMREGG